MTSRPGLEISRRKLLKVLGGGILVMASSPDLIAAGWFQRSGQVPQEISAWLHIAADGKITVFTGKVEVGQNARTSITQAVAEELRVTPEAITVTMADTDLVPYDMGTFGSRTTPTMIPQVRRAAAAAREALIDLAAKASGAPRAEFTAKDGEVFCKQLAYRATYGSLAKGQPIDKTIDANVQLTPPGDWKTLGTPLRKVGGRDFVTGKHAYTSDLQFPGMLHAAILRPPSLGATLESVDTSAAQAMNGVKVFHEGEFVGVAAPTARQARQGVSAIKATWQEKPQPSSKELFSLLRGNETPRSSASPPVGDKVLTGTYTAPYIAHVPLEPRAAIALWDGSKMTVYTGTQRPFGVRDDVAKALGLTTNNVRVIVPDTGSGYGGKHSADAAIEAARLAKAFGKPVKLIWSRQEEFMFAYFRPAGVVEIRSAVNPEGKLSVWEFDNYNSGGAGIETPYDVPAPRTDSHESNSPLRQGSYRGLASTFNNFAREVHMDTLAHTLKLDPLEFRLNNLSANPRLQAVLRAAAERFGWGKQAPVAEHGYGLACGTEKGGYVATVAEVSVDPQTKTIRVIRQVTAFECGAILNPDLLKNQVEGGVIMGLGGALFEAIHFENGKILNGHLSRYRVPRYSDIPQMETVLLDRKDQPSAGAGEAPIIAIAPAIANAVFAVAGVRLCNLPLSLTA